MLGFKLRLTMRCISCGNSEFMKYADQSYLNIPVFQCSQCKLIVTGNSVEQIRRTTSSMYFGEFWDIERADVSIKSDFTDSNSKGKYRNFISQFAFCKPFINNKKRVLEIGTGEGQTIFWLDQMGFEVTGIEPDARNVTQINQKLRNSKTIQCTIEDFEDNAKYEIVWVSHVLEHLAEPGIFLDKIRDRLETDGVVFMEVPNCDYPPTLNDSILRNPHIFHFTKNTLASFCQKSGFKIISCEVFRPASKMEGIINKLFRKVANVYPYYPRIVCDTKSGRDLRILLKVAT